MCALELACCAGGGEVYGLRNKWNVVVECYDCEGCALWSWHGMRKVAKFMEFGISDTWL